MPAWSRPLARRVRSLVCGVSHPEHPEYRCSRWPHGVGEDHYALVALEDDTWIEWPATEDSPARVVDVVPTGNRL